MAVVPCHGLGSRVSGVGLLLSSSVFRNIVSLMDIIIASASVTMSLLGS